MTEYDNLDITLHIVRGNIIKFALNYRALFNSGWHEVYRVDNHHGFLHEQRFWRSRRPIPLEEGVEIGETIELYKVKILKDYSRYHKLYSDMLRLSQYDKKTFEE